MTGIDKINDILFMWYTEAVDQLPLVLTAILIMIIFYIIARVIQLPIELTVDRFSRRKTIKNLFVYTAKTIVFSIGFLLALQVLGLDKAVISLLAGIGVVGFALGFAFKDIAANLIAGIIIAITSPFKIGDIVEMNGYMGIVSSINLRNSVIQTFTGQIIQIPNEKVFLNPVKNYSTNESRRVDITLGVGYEDDLPKLPDLIKKSLEKLEYIQKDSVNVFYDKFGSSSIDFTVYFWVQYVDEPTYLSNKSQAIVAIKEVLDSHGYLIPYPTSTITYKDSKKPY